MNPLKRVLLPLFCVVVACQTIARQPNIVFILADDLGYGDIGAFVQKKIRTPTLDRLALPTRSRAAHAIGFVSVSGVGWKYKVSAQNWITNTITRKRNS